MPGKGGRSPASLGSPVAQTPHTQSADAAHRPPRPVIDAYPWLVTPRGSRPTVVAAARSGRPHARPSRPAAHPPMRLRRRWWSTNWCSMAPGAHQFAQRRDGVALIPFTRPDVREGASQTPAPAAPGLLPGAAARSRRRKTIRTNERGRRFGVRMVTDSVAFERRSDVRAGELSSRGSRGGRNQGRRRHGCGATVSRRPLRRGVRGRASTPANLVAAGTRWPPRGCRRRGIPTASSAATRTRSAI
jgi:hypothetical protein